jgi:nitroreductase
MPRGVDWIILDVMTSPPSPLSRRYGAAAGPADVKFNDVLELMLSHKSVRAYLPAPVPEGTLEMIVAAAQSASSSSNLQVWSVVAVEDAERKARLSVLAGNQKHIAKAPLFLVWLADLARLDQQAANRGLKAEGLDFLESLLLGVIDTALAAQNAVLALESMGLASVYIGGIRNQVEGVAAELGLPPKVFPVFGMCIGYPDPDRPAAVKPRLPQAAVLHREQYDLAAQDASIRQYDRVMADFYASQGLPQSEWSQHSVRRVLTPTALHGREDLVNALKRLGFDLR